jgi:hypothetical protein
LTAYRRSLGIREGLAARDPENTGWQRDLSVSHIKIADVLVAQGDGPGALTAYRRSLGIREGLAARDPENAEWQVDLAVSLSRVGTSATESVGDRRGYLLRGLGILVRLREQGRLHASQDWIGWFEKRLGELEG